MTPVPPSPLLQLFRDAQAALAENAKNRRHTETAILELLGEALRIEREDAGWTIEQLARHAGTDAVTVRAVEAARALPSINVVLSYVDAQARRDPRAFTRPPEPRHLLTIQQMTNKAGHRWVKAFTACGQTAHTGTTVDVDRVTCEACMKSRAYQIIQTLNRENQ